MCKRVLSAAFVFIPVLAFAGIDTMWVRLYSGDSMSPQHYQWNQATDIVFDTINRHVFVAGSGEGFFGRWAYQNNTDMLLAMYGDDGTFYQARAMGGRTAGNDLANRLLVRREADTTFAYVTGYTNDGLDGGWNAAWYKWKDTVSATNRDSTLTQKWWDKTLYNGDDFMYDATFNKFGQMYQCGTRDTTIQTFTGAALCVQRIDPGPPGTGWWIWRRVICLDTLGFLLARNRVRPKRDLHPDFLDLDMGDWQDYENCGTGIAADPNNGNIVVAGYGSTIARTGSDSTPHLDWWILRFDSLGNKLWSRTFYDPQHGDGTDDDVAFDVAVAKNGNIYVGGITYANQGNRDDFDAAIAEFDSSGNLLNYRVRNYSTTDAGDDAIFSVTLDDSTPQNVYATGKLEDPNFGDQTLTFKLGSDLSRRWDTLGVLWGGTGDEAGYCVYYNKGRVYVAGRRGIGTGGATDDIAVLCYRAANPADTAWTYWYNGPDNGEDFATTVYATDSNNVYVGGQCARSTGGADWSSMFVARLFYRWPDAAAVQIIRPTGTVPVGTSYQPIARVQNVGTTIATFNTHMSITGPANYSDNVTNTAMRPGASADDTFPSNWTGAIPGKYMVRCSVYLAGDTNHTNDVAVDSVFVQGGDVSVRAIYAPTGVVEYGTSVTPRCSVYNFSSWALYGVPVYMQIGGYLDNTTVDLAPNGSAIASFVNWSAAPPGSHGVVSFTLMSGDENVHNDTATGTVWVRGRDIGVTAILSPPDSVDQGATVPVQARVRNYRDAAVPTFPVLMRIGATYSHSVDVAGLAPNESLVVNFPDWNPAVLGWSVMKCTLSVSGDTWFSNDTLRDSVFVRGPDVGATAILAPTGTYVPGAVVTPRAEVRNFRSVAQNVPVRMYIGAGYQYDTTVALAGSATDTAVFGDWTANPPGQVIVKCSTMLSTDVNPPNDWVTDTVFVAQHDVACLRIATPVGVVDSGTNVAPEAWLRNYGNTAETFNCRMTLGSFYVDVQSVTLAADDSVLQGFTNVDLNQRGTWAAICTTMLAGDMVESNDMKVDSFTVRVSDVAALAIVVPSDTVDSGTVLVPELRVANLGNLAETFWTHFLMQPVLGSVFYEDSLELTLAAAAESVVQFGPSAAVAQLGSWRARGWVSLGDQHPANDTAVKSFYVPGHGGVHWPHGWVEVQSMPLQPSSKQVKDGGSLTAMEDTAGPLIYGIKGAKTADFYSYDYSTNKWTMRKPVPPGREAKLPYKGARVCADGAGRVFLTKGNNTLGFWRYTAADSSWTQLEDVPLGTMRKRVKGGTDLVFVDKHDSGFVYMLKGYKNEFYRYNILRDTWETLPLAPQGASIKWDNGSFLVMGGEHTIYAHKAKYNELWKYDTDRDTWAGRLNGMPLFNSQGRRKKSKDGGAGAWFSGQIYAFKGGNTQEFWRYVAARDSWYESDTIPIVGSTGKKKRVKNGGDLVYNAYAIWALKGNRTVEFWRYGLLDDGENLPLAQTPERSGATAAGLTPAGWHFAVVPNPLAGSGALRFSVPYPTVLSARLYDASGRLAAEPVLSRVALGSGVLNLRTEGLSSGVYLLRLDAGRGRDVWGCKLVIR